MVADRTPQRNADLRRRWVTRAWRLRSKLQRAEIDAAIADEIHIMARLDATEALLRKRPVAVVAVETGLPLLEVQEILAGLFVRRLTDAVPVLPQVSDSSIDDVTEIAATVATTLGRHRPISGKEGSR